MQMPHGVQSMMVLMVKVFVFFKVLFFCLVVDICDLVHGVEAILHQCLQHYDLEICSEV